MASAAWGLPTHMERQWTRRKRAKAIVAAVEMGYTFFDTAECYLGNRADGSLARNEDLVGETLKPYRNRIKLATKCGVAHSSEGLVMDSRPETIRKSIEGSLRRLQTDHVDLYYQHRIDPMVGPEEVAGVMADLIKEGKILHWGFGNGRGIFCAGPCGLPRDLRAEPPSP